MLAALKKWIPGRSSVNADPSNQSGVQSGSVAAADGPAAPEAGGDQITTEDASLLNHTLLGSGALPSDDAIGDAGSAEKDEPEPGVTLVNDTLITFDGRTIAIGIHWISRTPELSRAAQAREFGEQRDRIFTHYVENTTSQQIAFLGQNDAVPAKAEAGATLFDPPARWLGAFQVSPTKVWLVGYRDGLNIHDMVGTITQIRSELIDLTAADTWDQVIAPDSWGIKDANYRPLRDLVRSHGATVRKLGSARTAMLGTTMAAMIVAGIGGGSWLWQDHVERQRAAEVAMQRAEQQRLRLENMIHPWMEAASPLEWVDVCLQSMNALYFSAPGWRQEDIVCSAGQQSDVITVATSWGRAGGTIDTLRMVRPLALDNEIIRLNGAGERASVATVVPVDAEATARDQTERVEPWGGSEIEQRLLDRWQVLGLPISLTPRGANPQRAATNTRGRSAQAEPLYGYHQVVLTMTAAVREQIALFSDVPAVVVEEMRRRPSGETQVVLRVFHPPILPTPDI